MTFAPPSGNFTSFTGFFEYMNATIAGWFMPGLVIAFFLIIAIKLLYSQNSVSRSFGTAGFMTIFIIFTGIGIVWMHVENTTGVQ